jgi:phosphatidylserine synthase
MSALSAYRFEEFRRLCSVFGGIAAALGLTVVAVTVATHDPSGLFAIYAAALAVAVVFWYRRRAVQLIAQGAPEPQTFAELVSAVFTSHTSFPYRRITMWGQSAGVALLLVLTNSPPPIHSSKINAVLQGGSAGVVFVVLLAVILILPIRNGWLRFGVAWAAYAVGCAAIVLAWFGK